MSKELGEWTISDSQKNFVERKICEEFMTLSELEKNEQFSFDDKLSCVNNILEFKKLINYDGEDSIYLDFKKYFKYYIKAVDEKDTGYDEISVSRTYEKLQCFKPSDRVTLLKSFKRELQLNFYASHAESCDEYIERSKLELYAESFSLESSIKYIRLWSGLNIKNLLLSVLAILVLTSVVISPAPFESWSTLNVILHDYSSVKPLNYVLNVLSMMFDLDVSMTVSANSVLGLLAIIAGKSLYILALINFIIARLIKHMNILD